MTFQSRFGRGEWLKPYTAETVRELAARGVKRLAVITPGFAADCLETLEEIGVENAGYFREAGGEHFAAIPCLNDSAEGMAVIEAVARRELRAGRGEVRKLSGHLYRQEQMRGPRPNWLSRCIFYGSALQLLRQNEYLTIFSRRRNFALTINVWRTSNRGSRL